ncbi:QueT transporter family protein [Tissierella pigra]|uniref:QueT transporter family protein n=1 Tax=Tissierella pigra TaxID=2607614 RepID=A0A6N7XCW1_9FIRM|nr:QueT transporter family protein [Tissierella pigra]MBU5426701.1 QueT transporter family protein [Tissierella pigra]MST99858.1 QueT transporter family protein [Tissierella pigra]
MNTRFLTKASLIAAIYIVLVLIQMLPMPLVNLTFGAIQLRIAEGLTLLPLVESAAIPGVFVGCLLANLLLAPYTGFGLVDILGGSLVTLIAAYITSKMKNKVMAMVPPIVLNGLIVSIWVSYYTSVPYLVTALGIGGGELLSVAIFGTLILSVYKKAANLKEY